MNLSEYHKGTYGSLYYVNDMAKAVQYYKEVLQWTPEVESPEWTEFPLGNGHRLCLHAAGEGQVSPGYGILITQVREIEQVVAELKRRGVEFVKDIQNVCDNGFSADFRDPSGNLISLYEYKG